MTHTHGTYPGRRAGFRAKAWCIAALLAALTIADLFCGELRLSPGDILACLSGNSAGTDVHEILVRIRIPRVLTDLPFPAHRCREYSATGWQTRT